MPTRRVFLLAMAGAICEQADFVVLDAATGSVVAKSKDTVVPFHPGSAVKPITATVALEHNLSGKYTCRGALRIGSRRLDCSHPRALATLDMSEALAYSCNGFFVALARRAGAVNLAAGFRRYGLDVATPATEEQASLLGIGEWGVTADLLEVARAYRQLSAQCKMPKYAPLMEGLEMATSFGTARLASPRSVRVAGKTGTSLRNDRSAMNAVFAGWAPAADPRIVVVVRVRGGAGGSHAAPAARELFEEYL